jgi:hypothetical protein
MENNETLVTEQVETVEQPTEQPKMFTQEEVNDIVGKRIARKEARIRKEYDRKYGQLEEVLKIGMGKEDVSEITTDLQKFYEKKGYNIPAKPNYTDSDIEVLASAEADDYIRSGFEEVVEEVDRLADIGVENMTARERAVFQKLATYRQDAERGRELSQIGVTEDVYNSDEFKNFAKQFNPTTPIKDVFDIYRKTQPQKEIRTMGSMKNNTAVDITVKDFYSADEAKKFTQKDFDTIPGLYEAVVGSMPKWRK